MAVVKFVTRDYRFELDKLAAHGVLPEKLCVKIAATIDSFLNRTFPPVVSAEVIGMANKFADNGIVLIDEAGKEQQYSIVVYARNGGKDKKSYYFGLVPGWFYHCRITNLQGAVCSEA